MSCIQYDVPLSVIVTVALLGDRVIPLPVVESWIVKVSASSTVLLLISVTMRQPRELEDASRECVMGFASKSLPTARRRMSVTFIHTYMFTVALFTCTFGSISCCHKCGNCYRYSSPLRSCTSTGDGSTDSCHPYLLTKIVDSHFQSNCDTCIIVGSTKLTHVFFLSPPNRLHYIWKCHQHDRSDQQCANVCPTRTARELYTRKNRMHKKLWIQTIVISGTSQ